jgi:hypothetical protein
MNATIPNSWNTEFQRSRGSNSFGQHTSIPNTWNMEVQESQKANNFGRNLATNPGNTWNRQVQGSRSPSTFGQNTVTPNCNNMDQRPQRTTFGQNGTTTNSWNMEIQRSHSAKNGWDELIKQAPRSQLHLRKNIFGLVD